MSQNPMLVSFSNSIDQPVYNLTATAVIRSGKCILRTIIVNAPGSSGSLVINDNAQTGATNTAANSILSIPFGSLTVGQIIRLEVFCQNGIVISAIPVGGGFSVVTR